MINNEEKFYFYLNNKMNAEERKGFEYELNSSSDLNAKFTEYKNLMNIMQEVKDINLNKEYSESIILNFRKNLGSKGKNKKLPVIKYAFATLIVVLVGYFLIQSINKSIPQDNQFVVSDFTDVELDSFSDSYHFSTNQTNNINEYDSNVIDSLYNQNISDDMIETISENRIDDILSINTITDVDEYLSENDIDEIYNQLIDKEIL